MDDPTTGISPQATAVEPYTQAGGSPPPATDARRRHERPRFASGRYYVALVVLLASALGMQGLAQFFAAHFQKEGLPLRKPLRALDVSKLAPEYALYPIQPKPLSDELIESLGTDEYLNWRLIDTTREPQDTDRAVNLFVTYYTNQPEMVPHNPRNCQQAAGWSLETEEEMSVTIQNGQGKDVTIPVAVLGFVPPTTALGQASNQKLTVLYFFYANGKYMTSGPEVKLATSNLFDRYAYYSKIELSFTNERGNRPADRETSKAAAGRFLRKFMPILWADHYPDWDSLRNKQGKSK